MSTTFSWKIANLERNTADGVVFTVHYTVNAEDGTYSVSAYGSFGLEAPEPDSMTPFDSLTEEVVVGWVKDKFGDEKVAEIEAVLQAQLDEKHAPSKAAGVPWATATSTVVTPVINAKQQTKNVSEGYVRARDEHGKFIADDPSTPDVNEAWVKVVES